MLYIEFIIIFLFFNLSLIINLNCQNFKYNDEKPKPKPPGVWKLKDYNVNPEWTEDEKKIPILLASLPNKVPKKFILEQVPLPMNQGNQASGTAFAVGYFGATLTQLKNPKVKRTYQCAPAFIYNSISKGLDNGIEILDAMNLLMDKGCPEEDFMKFNFQDSASQPSSRAKENAAKYKIHGFSRVEFSDLDQVRAHLLQEKPVYVTLTISDNFITLKDAVWSNPAGYTRGRHTVGLYGYDDEKNVFYFINSVGSKWGKNGYSAITYTWFVRLVKQAYVMW